MARLGIIVGPCFILIAVLVCSLPLRPQSPVTRRVPGSPLRVDTNLVIVPVSVSDGMSRAITGLDSRNFRIYEEGKEQEIRYFATEDAPISVALLLDFSRSMRRKFETELDAVSEFFKNANAKDDYVVISFSDRPRILADSTESINAIQARLAAQVPDGNTALLDAVFLGESQMRSAQYRRRALLLISDGGDNHSRYHLREIKRMVQDSDAEVYALGVFDEGPFKSFEEMMGKKWLEQITDASGGETIAVDKASRLPEAAAQISRAMRQRYILGYLPDSRGGDLRRKITVQVMAPNSAKPVRAYYKTSYLPRKN